MPSMSPIPYTRSDRVDLRYIPWAELSTETQNIAQKLNYTETTWNEIGTASVELLNWERLTESQQNAAQQLGYDLFSWDCWLNHFQSYRFIDLDNPYIQVGQWWKRLGWTINAWNRYDNPPPSDELTWYELSSEERFAASQLCYMRTTWDEGEKLVDGFPIKRPEFRYVHWSALSDNVREVADDSLKYHPLYWNVLGLGKIESKDWESLTEYEKGAASSIGFTQLNWDCWQ